MPSSLSGIVFAASLALVAAACSAAPPSETDETGETSQAVSGTIATCSTPLACCVGSPGSFTTSDPFEAQLAAWGCSSPKLYEPVYTNNAYWFWTVCSDPNKRVENFLAANTKFLKSPYYAVVNPATNTACAPTAPPGSVNVLWDPTCSTCRTY
jgi:hypothetical protein